MKGMITLRDQKKKNFCKIEDLTLTKDFLIVQKIILENYINDIHFELFLFYYLAVTEITMFHTESQ